MPGDAQELSWRRRAERRRALLEDASTPQPKSSASSDKLSNQAFPEQENELVDEVLEHCFQKHKFEEEYPQIFLKLKASRFGPPKSRHRTLIAPPMEGTAPCSPKPHLPIPLCPKAKPFVLEEHPVKAKATGRDDLQVLHAWIEERKKLQDLLNNCVNLEKWLKVKQPISDHEESVLGKMRECKKLMEVKAEALVSAVSSIQWDEVVKVLSKNVDVFQQFIRKQPQKKIIPSIQAPYPDSLLTLQNTLQKHKLKLVDIFSKVDKSRTMKFKRKDFLKVMQETKVPLSPSILEDAVVHLSLKKRKYITSEDIAECQRIWLTNYREQRETWKPSKETKPGTARRGRQREYVGKASGVPPGILKSPRATSAVSPAPASAGDKPKTRQTSLSPNISLLQVPPINTEPDCMHLSYSQMEMVGKRSREMRRRLKRKIDPLEWLEQCRMVRTGDRAVDGHCMPSTIEGEMGEVVDKFRLDTHLVYHRCVKICEARGIPISERVLKRALLYAGDRIIKDGNNIRKLRQPGGPYGSIRDISSDEESSGSSRERKRVPKKKTVAKKQVRHSKPLNSRWKSYAEFKSLMKSAKHADPFEIWTVKSFDDGMKARQKSIYRLSPVMLKDRRNRTLIRMYRFLNPLTTSNSFWPGHLLDKLRLCWPEMQGDEAEVLFSHVRPTRLVYPATYNPDRSWPLNDQGYVIYGDPDARKKYLI